MRKTLKVVAFGGGPADAFIKAAGITDSTQQTAIKTLVNDLNGYGLWTKMKAIYPMVGGNATSHSYNLKNPSQFQIAFSGGWTHSLTGALPNGTNAYGNTGLTPLSTLGQDNNHISFYSRTSGGSGGVEIRSSEGNNYMLDIEIDYGGRYFSNNTNSYASGTSAAITTGLFTNSRISSGTYKGYRNSTIEQTNNISSTGRSSNTIYIGAANIGYPTFYSPKQCAFASIGDGLSDAEVSNLYTIIQNYQTILNRQV
jgi:hypothetical protein